MGNGGENTNWGLRRMCTVAAAVAAVVALFAAEFYYKAHPQFLEQHLSSFGIALLCIVGGCYLAFRAIMGLRSGAIDGNYVSVKFKRSDRPFMFWFVLVFDFAGSAFLFFCGIGHFFGLW